MGKTLNNFMTGIASFRIEQGYLRSTVGIQAEEIEKRERNRSSAAELDASISAN